AGTIGAERSYVLSTEKMLTHARSSSASRFLVATETGILHRLEKELPGKRFEAADPSAVCRYMKMITPLKLRDALRDLQPRVEVDPGAGRCRRRARRQEAYHVDVVGDGIEGLAAAQRLAPDVVVLDVMLPGIDGLQVARRLRADGNVPILMLTARDAMLDTVE